MAIIMGKDCIEAIYGLMGWKGLKHVSNDFRKSCIISYFFIEPDLHP